jgi:hypothetical protein
MNELVRAVSDSLAVPLMVVDETLRVHYLNAAAQKLSEQQAALQMHTRCGDVLQCINALQPGACCGETDDCPKCAIRQLVARACQEQQSFATRAYIRREAAGDTFVNVLVRATGFMHEGQPLASLMLQDLPEVIDAAGLLRLCAWCHKVGDPDNNWVDLTEYLATTLSLNVTHGMCKECADRWHAERDGE